METVLYSKEFKIPHEKFLELYKARELRLGINNSLTIEIATNRYLKPQKTTASAALIFWSWVGILIFIYSIYLSITSNWWYFILGFIAWRVLWKGCKKGTSENLLDAALVDKEFYEKIADIGGWSYLTESKHVRKLKQSSQDVLALANQVITKNPDELDLGICQELIIKSGFPVVKAGQYYEVETDEMILESDNSELQRMACLLASRVIAGKFVSCGAEFWGD